MRTAPPGAAAACSSSTFREAALTGQSAPNPGPGVRFADLPREVHALHDAACNNDYARFLAVFAPMRAEKIRPNYGERRGSTYLCGLVIDEVLIDTHTAEWALNYGAAPACREAAVAGRTPEHSYPSKAKDRTTARGVAGPKRDAGDERNVEDARRAASMRRGFRGDAVPRLTTFDRKCSEYPSLAKGVRTLYVAFSVERALLHGLLWCALGTDLVIRPCPRLGAVLPHEGLPQRVSDHPYDDRGMDVVGNNQPLLALVCEVRQLPSRLRAQNHGNALRGIAGFANCPFPMLTEAIRMHFVGDKASEFPLDALLLDLSNEGWLDRSRNVHR